MRACVPTRTGMLTISLVVLYLAISVLAGTCPGSDAPSAAGHHDGTRHQGNLHAVLCALACQANLAFSLVAMGPNPQPVLVLLGTVAATLEPVRMFPPHSLRARAPPSPLAVL